MQICVCASMHSSIEKQQQHEYNVNHLLSVESDAHPAGEDPGNGPGLAAGTGVWSRKDAFVNGKGSSQGTSLEPGVCVRLFTALE